MNIQTLRLARPLYGLMALMLMGLMLILSLSPKANAAQVTARKITMSDSAPSATGVTYQVSFVPTTGGTLGGIVVDFCANTPLIGDTSCTYPAGFTMGATPTVSGITGIGTGGSWVSTNSLQGGASGGQTQVFKYTNSTAQTVTGSPTPIVITITGVTNTSAVGSFYARIVTFDTATNAINNYTASGTTRAASFGGQVDYGGVALSTAAAINITARVMETIDFCVYVATCGDVPSITLGHGTNDVLDSTVVDTENVTFRLSTNASGGAKVNIKGDTLKSGSNDIDPMSTAGAMSFGPTDEHFGLFVATAGTNITVTAPYDTSDYYFNPANTTTTYGEEVCQLTAPTNNSITTLTYGATASNTTAAGIYTATHQLIATGTF